jgi:hypothetical protein
MVTHSQTPEGYISKDIYIPYPIQKSGNIYFRSGVKSGLSSLKRGHITLKLVLCRAFGYMRFSVEALFGIGAFGYTRLWVRKPAPSLCSNIPQTALWTPY